MGTSRIQKRDKPIVQIRKLVNAQIQSAQSNQGGAVVFVSNFDQSTTGQDPKLTDGGAGVAVQVAAYDTADTPTVPTSVTRSQLTPKGALFASDDSTNDQIILKHSILADPLFCLYNL